jgi:fimbrial chaperone protein
MRPLAHSKGAAARFRRVAACAALACLPTWAGAVTVSPVLVQVTPARPVATVTLANPGDHPMRFQVQVLAWSQRDGIEQRVSSDDLIVAPAIAEIPAGGQQIFRIATRVPAEGAERAYRLVLEDLGADTARPGEVGIRLRVNHDLPVFVSAAGLAPARLQLGPCAQASPGCVRVRNDGDRFGVVRALQFDAAGWHKDLTVNTRVLAGAWREWQVEAPIGARDAQVRATTGDGELTSSLTAR